VGQFWTGDIAAKWVTFKLALTVHREEIYERIKDSQKLSELEPDTL